MPHGGRIRSLWPHLQSKDHNLLGFLKILARCKFILVKLVANAAVASRESKLYIHVCFDENSCSDFPYS